MQAVFRLLPGILWSDGEPVKASDSVFLIQAGWRGRHPVFQISVRPHRFVRGAGRSVRRMDRHPRLPRPRIPGQLLVSSARARPGPAECGGDAARSLGCRSPLGWGPYRLVEWTQGRDIELERNPRYFRADEGLPAFDRLLFRFVGEGPTSAVQQVLTGECDILDDSLLLDSAGQGWPAPSLLATLESLDQQGDLAMTVGPSSLVTRLDFNLAPIDTTSLSGRLRPPGAAGGGGLPGPAKSLTLRSTAVWGGFRWTAVPPGHPLARPEAEANARGAEQAAESLTAAGWVDSDGDPSTPRSWAGAWGSRRGLRCPSC